MSVFYKREVSEGVRNRQKPEWDRNLTLMKGRLAMAKTLT